MAEAVVRCFPLFLSVPSVLGVALADPAADDGVAAATGAVLDDGAMTAGWKDVNGGGGPMGTMGTMA